jgi:hypothetical protein
MAPRAVTMRVVGGSLIGVLSKFEGRGCSRPDKMSRSMSQQTRVASRVDAVRGGERGSAQLGLHAAHDGISATATPAAA